MNRWIVRLRLLLARGIVAALMLVVMSCERQSPENPDTPQPTGEWRFDPDGFRTVMIRANGDRPFVPGNSLEGFAAARAQRLPFVEVDLLLTKDSILIAAHDSTFGGNCGEIIERELEQLRECARTNGTSVATIDDLLTTGFHETFLDLKVGYLYPELNDLAVTQAVRAIVTASAERRTVVMLYDVTAAIADLFHTHGIRGGTKGYPSTPSEVLALVDLAAQHGLEMMCSEAQYLTPELVGDASARGVWLLPWDLRGLRGVEHARSLADAGIGGMIVRDVGLTDREIRPSWRGRRDLR